MDIDKSNFGCFGKLKKRPKPTAIVIHHTCTVSHKATIRALKGQKYSTHFEVEKDGTIYQYADVMTMCCHCGSPNWTTIGIDVTHMKDAPWPKEQVDAVHWLVTYLCNLYDIKQEVHMKLEGIYPHKAIGQTACPQDFPMDELE